VGIRQRERTHLEGAAPVELHVIHAPGGEGRRILRVMVDGALSPAQHTIVVISLG
jgi:hypothetical protein